MTEKTGIAGADPAAGFMQRIGYEFRDGDLLAEALTHGSTGDETNYQRLEFLGDRVLSLVISELLFRRFPEESEGAMTKRLAGLVRRETLAEIARQLSLADAVKAAVPAGSPGMVINDRVLGDVVEAIIGAIFLDGGFAAARQAIEGIWSERLGEKIIPDPKSALQEWLQRQGHQAPRYETVKRSGPDHAPRFRIRADVPGVGAAEAEGGSKREAEKAAAEILLRQLTEDGADDG